MGAKWSVVPGTWVRVIITLYLRLGWSGLSDDFVPGTAKTISVPANTQQRRPKEGGGCEGAEKFHCPIKSSEHVVTYALSQ